jgi:hypothetical protein
MANTYVKIGSVTVGLLGAATIDFTSIPSTYTDLQLLLSLKGDGGGVPSILYQFNTTTTGYSSRTLYTYNSGTPASGSFTTATNGFTGGRWGDGQISTTLGAGANTFASVNWYIPNYAGSTNKSWSAEGVAENNGTPNELEMIAGLWSNTAAITAIKIGLNSGNFAQYSTATLYGIKNS